MKIYVASSWRNQVYPDIVALLRSHGHDVYDFRNPPGGGHGFGWSEIDPNWKTWTPEQYREHLNHPLAEQGFQSDMAGLIECDVCVLVMPAGRSANWELGFAMGQGKRGYVLLLEPCEPELMWKEALILTSTTELLESLELAEIEDTHERTS